MIWHLCKTIFKSDKRSTSAGASKFLLADLLLAHLKYSWFDCEDMCFIIKIFQKDQNIF